MNKNKSWSKKRIESQKILKIKINIKHFFIKWDKKELRCKRKHNGYYKQFFNEGRFKKGHITIMKNIIKYKISNTLMGHKVSEETRKKISISLKSKKMIPWNKKNFKEKTKYEVYKNKVKSLSIPNIRKKYRVWNGICEYSKEYIRDNKDKNKPSIDHKISIYAGFKNKLPHEIVAAEFNLAICKLAINAKKNKRCIPIGITLEKLY